jgi:hypothetical protein
MKVERIVANMEAQAPAAAKRFYQDVLGLEVLMGLGWIATYGSGQKMNVQISFVSHSCRRRGFLLIPAEEPWGVRRFYVCDPFGKLVNILTHLRLARTAVASPSGATK